MIDFENKQSSDENEVPENTGITRTPAVTTADAKAKRITLTHVIRIPPNILSAARLRADLFSVIIQTPESIFIL